ncbi:hypothetical protein AAVH_16431 [Aphelenchoides avenae]|nr:hypothetical protein AAVH_16431 [Aphelenchus avenae]
MTSPALAMDFLAKLHNIANANPVAHADDTSDSSGRSSVATDLVQKMNAFNGANDNDSEPSRHSSMDITALFAAGNENLWSNISRNSLKEKKKFSQEVSDVLVTEVLKRKDLLVENNTSRDLTFSENKRVAWNEVRSLLVGRFAGFDLNVEAIKSHWRYRKRKVTDAYQELKSSDNEKKELQKKLTAIDWEIYAMLKESNMLDKAKSEPTATSPSDL